MTVQTPITQALQDGTITRRELKTLMQRSDRPGLTRLIGWILTVAITGTLVWMSMGTWWLLPAMFVHGIVLVHHFSLQHECCHYTAFKTRWLNDFFGNICGLIIFLPNRHFRYEHCDHHTYTQLKGKDPELIELPISVWKYLAYISAFPFWRMKFTEIARHVVGRLSDDEKRFIPKEEYATVFWEARIMVLFYLALLILCIATGWTAPLYYWFIPVFLGEPVMRAIRLTEHVGRPNISDMKENTRTNLVTWPMQFLCWNMNYHAEHHYAASVPFFALPELHEKLKDHVYIEKRGYLGAHIDIISQLIGIKPRSDAPSEPAR
ncbi:MAG: fatty acid desaturase family protein [Alphaproteobacteria bacterium]|nr:fatty acid desaturase family protein [Alphaproteobacteria bacterium]